jgi:DNA adenine methylase
MASNIPKQTPPGPFIRWAGGKSKVAELIVSTFIEDFDKRINKFYEPFAGSAAVSFYLSRYLAGSNLIINDVNPDLMITYHQIVNNLDELLKELKKIKDKTTEIDYYKIRDSKPTTDAKKAARFIYLNKTSFNGLWRVNSNGQYNVPFGKKSKPNIMNSELLISDSKYLIKTKLRSGSYTASVNDAKKGDVVYFDPPYIPLSNSSSFSQYAKDDFLEADHWALSGLIKGLTKKGVKVILSNSDTELTKNIYSDILDIRLLDVRRSIGASANTRILAKEILGFNFVPKGPLVGSLIIDNH